MTQLQTANQTPKTISASEAKNRLGAVMDQAVKKKSEIIVESHGEPKAVILSYRQYLDIKELLERIRREQAVKRLEELRKTTNKRHLGLTEGQAWVLADRFTREVIEKMISEDKITYEEK